MKVQPAQRAVVFGQYIIENRATVRMTAKKFGISKSTVHSVVKKRMEFFNINYKKQPSLVYVRAVAFCA